MLDETTKTALEQNSGTIIGWLAAGAAALWAMVKVLPVFNGGMDAAAKSVSVGSSTLMLVIAERDKLKAEIETLSKKYEEVFRSEVALRAQTDVLIAQAEASKSICAELREQLTETRALLAAAHGHMKRADKFIKTNPSSHDEGTHHG